MYKIFSKNEFLSEVKKKEKKKNYFQEESSFVRTNIKSE